MIHDIFISYSSKNKQIADSICHILEETKIKCWIAPRDILSGTEYSEAIPPAIKKAKVFIIIFSEAASLSQWVKSEIRIAFENNIPILPFRIDRTEPNGQFELFLQGRHWIDAISDPENYFEKICSDAKSLIEGKNLETLKIRRDKHRLFFGISAAISILIILFIIITNNSTQNEDNYLYGIPPAPPFQKAEIECSYNIEELTTENGVHNINSIYQGFILSYEIIGDGDMKEYNILTVDSKGVNDKFYLYDSELSNATRSWLSYFLIPGNRVEIKYYLIGNSGIKIVMSLKNIKR